MKKNFSKGSEWRKWDLHVHTPASYNFTGTYDQVIKQIEDSDVSVIGINDYFTISGYKEINSRIKNKSNQFFLPVVEMRMNNVLKNRHNTNSGVRINFHIIFNVFDEGKKLDLIPFIESFIKSISYKKCSGQEGLIADIYDDKQKLFEEVTVDFDKVLDKLEKSEELVDNYLIWLPYDEYGGVDEVESKNFPFKPALINRADIIGSSNEKEIEYFLAETEDYLKYFDKKKPCIKGSDSHKHSYPIGKLKDKESKPINKKCWIKADSTFEGLRQIVREPEERIFIGQFPEKIKTVIDNSTKYIKSISIRKVDSAKTKDVWFNNEIVFNPGLVSIIGNKGKGKSALAEIISLCGNTKNYKHFSFLVPGKFKKNKLASDFEAELQWEDGSGGPINLNDVPDAGRIERVKCIPQNYLEILCNNLDEKFQEEIDSVIFSHIDNPGRLGKQSLEELIKYKTQLIDDRITEQRDKSIKYIKELVRLEGESEEDFKISLKAELELARENLRAYYKSKPVKVEKPEQDEGIKEHQELLYKNFEEINKKIDKLEASIRSLRDEQTINNEMLEKTKLLEGRLKEQENKIKQFKEEIKGEINEILGKDADEIIKIEINLSEIQEKHNELNKKKKDIEKKLSEEEIEEEKSLIVQLKKRKAEKLAIKEILDEPSKKYQDYKEQYKKWRMECVTRNKEKNKLKNKLIYVDNNLVTDIDGAKSKIAMCMKNIHDCFEEKVMIYEEIYERVIKFIDEERDKNKYMELNFSAEIMTRQDFELQFLAFIDQGKKGTFQGKKEGPEELREIIQKYNFSCMDDCISFVDEVIKSLKEERKGDKVENRKVENQLVDGKTKTGLYSYLYMMKFITIDYRLKWGEKLLKELSPGERGTVLLIFYLLIDKADIPLVIDQPEENLDNESVFYLLVRYIKEAKKRRQIFIVTHNPNLAVVCDSEQIVYCDIEKKNKYKIKYSCGSIENPLIRSKIIDVLEGTRPAFCNRQEKYDISKRL